MNEIRNTPLTKKERNRLYLRYLLFGCPGVDAIYIQGKAGLGGCFHSLNCITMPSRSKKIFCGILLGTIQNQLLVL